MKTFLTPIQYNEIFSASTDIVINGSASEEKSYLLDKISALESKIEILKEAMDLYANDKTNWIARKALKEINELE